MSTQSDHRVITGDCLDPETGLYSLPDKSVDVTVTDPPYSRDLYTRTRTNKGTGQRPCGRPTSRGEIKEHTSALQLAANKIGAIDDILEVVAAELLRVTKRWIVVFCDDEITHRWRGAFGTSYIRTGIWAKTDPMPQVTGDRPAQGHEPAIIAHPRGRKRWNGGGRPALWIYGTSKGLERPPGHPCPKPIALMRRLVEDFSDRGEVVLDPFTGSGTTGIACAALGRRFVGYEINPEYAEIARRRIAGMDPVDTAQMGLFG